MSDLFPVLLVLARLTGLAGLLLLLPLAFQLSHGGLELRPVLAYAIPALISFLLYLTSRWFKGGDRPQLRTPLQGFLCVALGWVLFALIGSAPYMISGALPGFVDSFFEAMSGFTTTGASVFVSVDAAPKALLLWRALTQFIGGLGIIALFVAILPALGAGGVVLFRSEVAPKVLEDRLRPRIQDTAKLLWYLYTGLCTAQFLALLGCGMSWYDAVCHALTTVSTGGFSTHDQSMAGFDPSAQWVVTLFMFLGGTSFLLHGRAVQGDVRAYFKSEEFRLYTVLLVAGIVVMTALLAGKAPDTDATGLADTLRLAAFQVTAVMTGTGYAVADYDAWAETCRLLLMLLMIVGGCSGSTAGGVKVFRFLLLFRAVRRQLQALLSPSRVLTVRFTGTTVDDRALLAAALLLTLFTICVAGSALLLTLMGVPLLEALTGSMSCITCLGPAFGEVGPAGNFSGLPDAAKLLLTVLMLMGRLELYAVLVLLALIRFRRQ